MVDWTEWFNVTTDLRLESLLGTISYGIILLWTIIFQGIITTKVRNSKVRSDAFLSFRLLYVAVTFVTISYFTDFLGNLLSGSILNGNFSIAISVIGYTIAITALNIFMLRIINFRTTIRKVIKILAYIEAFLLSWVSIMYLVASFVVIGTPEITEQILDTTIISFGFIVISASIFTIVTLLVEARNTANKMVKLRLQLASIGTIGILFDGLANIIHVLVSSIGIDDHNYYTFIMPSLALLFYFTFMISYYYSLFTPMWLQRTAGVLPPSFSELMKKQAELKKVEGASN